MNVTVDLLDLTTDPARLLRLGSSRKKHDDSGSADCPACHIQFVHFNSSRSSSGTQPVSITRITPSCRTYSSPGALTSS
jgi:hypothetical protein